MSYFVTEIPLRADSHQTAELNKRFEAGRQVYNACVGECIRRIDLLRDSRVWQTARAMPKGKERTAMFKQAEQAVCFSKYEISAYAKQFGYSWIGQHIDSQTVSRIAIRAYTWAKEYLYDPNGHGKPKFKRYKAFNSLESKNNIQGIIWREDKVIWNAGRHGKTLILAGIIDPTDETMQHGLSSEIKYVRLVRWVINGKTRFFAQLVNAGKPLQRVQLGYGVVGMDIGPSTIAIVHADDEAELGQRQLLVFCSELKKSEREIKLLERKLERQRRAANPDNYEPDKWVYPKGRKPVLKQGKIKKGPKKWVKSNRYIKTQQKLAELKRKQAEHRKSLHGQLINTIIRMGDVFKLEKLSYKAFQRLWGKSVGNRAPGMFVARLRQRVNDLDGLIDEFSTYKTRLSQVCHNCGQVVKKPLSQRWHKCDCGVTAQRDLYSAFLATCVESEELNAALASERWAWLGPIIQAALSDVQTGDGEALPASFGLRSEPEPVVCALQPMTFEAENVVTFG